MQYKRINDADTIIYKTFYIQDAVTAAPPLMDGLENIKLNRKVLYHFAISARVDEKLINKDRRISVCLALRDGESASTF